MALPKLGGSNKNANQTYTQTTNDECSYLTFSEGMDMAKTRDYMDYLDNQIGIAPANSQEEFQAAETIVEVMKDHGIEPTVQEFDTHPLGVLMPNVLALVLFLGVLLTGLGGGIRVLGLVLALVAAVLLELHHSGNDVLANVGPVQRSQNVIGVHRASGENVVKGSRPIVIVAHYDTPRENALFGKAFARYQSTLYKNAYICVIVAAVVAITQMLGFLPVIARVVLWIVGLVACVPLIVVAVANIMEKFAGCTAGSNDNKASVAAMLSVLNQVSPAEDRVDAAAEGKPYARRASEDQKPETVMVPEQPVGVRHGKEVIESLGMLPASCEIVYEEPKLISVPAVSAQGAEPAAALGGTATNAAVDQTGDGTMPSPSQDNEGQSETGEAIDEGAPIALDSDGDADGQGVQSKNTAVESQENDEYYLDNTDDGFSGNTEYSRISPESVQETSETVADSTLKRDAEVPGKRNGAASSGEKKSGGSRIKAWFGRVKNRFVHDDNPVQIARGKNKEQEEGYSDYSQYETSYDGDDEIDQWSSEETEELRPLTKHDIRGGRAEAGHRINTEADSSQRQSLGDIYGLSQDDGAAQDESVDDEPEGNADVQVEDVEFEDTVVSESAPSKAEPANDSQADVEALTTSGEGEEPDADYEGSHTTEDGVDSDSVDAERAENTDTATSEADNDGWDTEFSDTDADSRGESDAPNDSESEEKIPESVALDTDQPRRRVVRKRDEDREDDPAAGSTDESVDEVQATVVPDEGDAPEPDAQLNWDQPSVEDEEYYEEYPDDYSEAADYGDSDADDEYYDDYDQYGVDDSSVDEDVASNVYEEAGSSKGGFRRFVNRIKEAFSRKSSRDASQASLEQPYADSGYDEESADDLVDDSLDSETEGQSENDSQTDDVVAFEEVKSEEYLPSDKDAFGDDVDDDYDFPDDEDGAKATPDAQDQDSNDAATPERASKRVSLRFEEEVDDRGDILPKDTTGLDALLDDDYADSRDVPRSAPEPIDDPSWGKSTYEPPVSRVSIARRAALLDLPNPSNAPVDPLGDDNGGEYADEQDGTGVGSSKDKLDDTAAQKSAGGNRKRNWKGGAAVRSDLRSEDPDESGDAEAYEEEPAVQNDADQVVASADEDAPTPADGVDEGDVQDAILDLGNDLLLSHDVWFVAVGASSVGHAGIKSFLANFRKDIRGAFLVNLDSIGAGVPVVLTREGLNSGKRADRRSLRLFENTAKDLHVDVQSIDYGWRDTDATPAMRSRVRSITVMGMDENGLPALSHTLNDVPMNVDPKQVSSIVRVVCEFIRRS